MDFHSRKIDTDNDTRKATAPYTASRRRKPPMTNKWRGDGNPRNRNPAPRQRNRSQSPAAPPRRPDPHSAGRGRFNGNRNDFQQRPNRKRDYSPDQRRNIARRPSISPARSPNRLPSSRNRYPGDSAYSSRESSPARFSKRRRTRSPSPSDYSDRGFDDRRRYSRSRSRERVERPEQRETRPGSRRGFSPRRSSPPRSARKGPRAAASDVDTYIPERRRPASPPSRQRPRRSPSPRPRSITPPSRRRSLTPPSRRYTSRPGSPSSRYDSPLPNRRGPRDQTPEPPARRKPISRTPSVAGDNDQEPMEGPFAARGNYGHQNHMQRGRGHRPYYNNRGAYRGSPVNNATPTTSHQGSPTHSYHGGRGGWDGPQQHNQQFQNNQPYRQNNYQGGNQSQDDYYRNQPPPPQQHYQYPNQSQRPYRGGRGQQRGAFNQHGPDRRFSGQEYPDAPFSQRGRGGQYQNAPWHQPRGRGGPNQVMTGPNSIRNSPALSHRDTRDEIPSQRDEQDDFRPPRGPQADNPDRRHIEQETVEQPLQDTPQSQKDAKFSFAFKSKPMPPSPIKPKASDLSEETRPPPSQPASDRPPPTQPRGNKFQDKRPYNQSYPPPQNHHAQFDRRQDTREQPFRPPKGPQNPYNNRNAPDRARPPPTEPRNRSRSPPPKKLKVEAPFKPTLTDEMAASDSIYFRKPGNESVVGAGTYGKVFKAIHIFTKDEVALKKIRMEGERDGFPITAVREIKLLQNLRHKHVVQLQEVMVEKNECFMVFEYMSHDLTGLINHPTFKLTAAHKKDLGRQMFEGLEFLHRRGVMHRDIKAANLLISSDGQLKYADFGLARFYTKSRRLDYTNRVITIWYRPPELLLGETQYGPAVDIWSAACVFMEMFTRKAIFPGEGGELSQLEKIYNVLGTPTSSQWPGITDLPWYELVHPAAATHPASGERRRRVFEPQFEDVLSPAAMDLVTQIFAYDPARRPDAATILEHDYFCVEEPRARQAIELAEVGGDWHEYESKAHRKENERREKERRKEEHVKEREREKKKAKEGNKGKGIDEVPAAPMPIGEEENALSDGEGSARMSMS